jgi:hypothetical protein
MGVMSTGSIFSRTNRATGENGEMRRVRTPQLVMAPTPAMNPAAKTRGRSSTRTVFRSPATVSIMGELYPGARWARNGVRGNELPPN